MLPCYGKSTKFSELIPLSPNRPSWVLCWRWIRTIRVLGYGGRWSWVVVALVAMAALLASSTLALSSLSLFLLWLVLQQTFLWNIYHIWWLIEKTSCLVWWWWYGELCFLHWKSTPLVPRALHQRKGKKFHTCDDFDSWFELFWRVPRHSRLS